MLSFENITAIIFVLGLTLFLYIERRKIQIIKIFFPVLYIVQMKAAWGLHLMEKYGKKYKHQIQFIGYIGIGIGFMGMVLVAFSLVQNIWNMFTVPDAANSLQIVLPGTTIPGLGTLHFWHWIISIFVLAVVHEFSHGVMAFAHGVRVKSSGAAIVGVGLPLLPAAFVEPDEKQLNNASDVTKYSVFVAGPLSNLMLGTVLLFVMSLILAPIGDALSDPVGVSFIAIEDDSYPAKDIFTGRTTIVEIDGVDVQNPDQFLNALECLVPNQQMTFKDDNDKKYSLLTADHPTKDGRGFVGVNQIQQEIVYHNPMWGKVFVWFRDLIKWMAALNIFIGIANLIPAGPLDGGQMLRTFLERILEKKKAQKIAHNISLFILALVIGSFILPLFL